MRPDMKNGRYEFQAGLIFVFVYMKNSYQDGRKTVVCNSLVQLC